MTPLVHVSDLVKNYRSGSLDTPVLKGIELDLHEGEFVALLGPSGSGKSTLLSILGTLLRPTRGSIQVKGFEVVGLSDSELTVFRNRYLGFVFQFHHLLPEFTAIENVYFPLAARRGWETQAMKDRAEYLLDRVGLADRMHYRANKLSGGQKQRVAIARALVNSPLLVLADEPTGNLDQETASQVMDLLREINQHEGTTFFISTHDSQIASRCDRRITVIDGKITSNSNVQQTAYADNE
ncbi:ABC transporter ATP-binding protein [bacterium]|nr:ABC transporter ATP-binding protein [bacterium]